MRPPKRSLPSNSRRVALVVVVVAAAHEQEAAGQRHGLAAVAALHLHGPARVGARPLGAHDPVPEADLALDAVLAGGLAHVVEDRRTVGDRLGLRPGPERVAEREHVRVRADARVAEQVPGAADVLARLEDRVGLAGALRLQLAAGADAGQAGADDQHVEMFGRVQVLVRYRRASDLPRPDARPRSRRPRRSGRGARGRARAGRHRRRAPHAARDHRRGRRRGRRCSRRQGRPDAAALRRPARGRPRLDPHGRRDLPPGTDRRPLALRRLGRGPRGRHPPRRGPPRGWTGRFGEDEVPPAVAATFARGGRNFQQTHDERAERRTAELWEEHGPG